MSKKRLYDINNIINNLQIKNPIQNIISEYKDELEGFTYIDSVERFSLLKLGNLIRYVNKYTKELRFGGIVIKIYEKTLNNWYAIVKKHDNTKYNISFNNNYIFYKNNDKMKEWAECFITELENGNYEIE